MLNTAFSYEGFCVLLPIQQVASKHQKKYFSKLSSGNSLIVTLAKMIVVALANSQAPTQLLAHPLTPQRDRGENGKNKEFQVRLKARKSLTTYHNGQNSLSLGNLTSFVANQHKYLITGLDIGKQQKKTNRMLWGKNTHPSFPGSASLQTPLLPLQSSNRKAGCNVWSTKYNSSRDTEYCAE